MSKTIVNSSIILMFTCVLTFVKGQTYYFTNDSAIWVCDRFAYDLSCPFYNAQCWRTIYFIEGDTTIQNVDYKKLQGKGFNYQFWMPSKGYAGAIRQDIPGKKVYFIPNTDSTEELLYDFDLMPGDTLPQTLIHYAQWNTQVVDSIDSVLVGQNYHKRIWTTTEYNAPEFLWEGIGSSSGLLQSFDGDGFEIFHNLNCFNVGDSSYLEEWTEYECDIPFEVAAQFPDSSDAVRVFPVPASSWVSVAHDFQCTNGCSLELQDCYGREILHQLVTNHSITINLSIYPAGVYFIMLHTGSGAVLKRIVKSE